MKCPKCGYLCLDPVERCRHCGYRFSLNTPTPSRNPELPLRQSEARAVEPLDDLELIDRAASPPPASPHDVLGERIVRTNGQAGRRDPSERDVPDLPLFANPANDDVPLITRASAPRAPLAVRRSTPEVPRLRTERIPVADPPLPGLEAPESGPRFESERRSMPRDTPSAMPDTAGDMAGVVPRTIGAAIDLLVLLGIDALVVYFTLQISGITWAERAILPKVPLIAFLVVQNLGYLMAFTAGGQTLGQMAMGIRVVAGDGHRPPPPAQAIVRTLVWVGLTLPAGLGLLPTLFDRERRGLHDRAAQTRVIRL